MRTIIPFLIIFIALPALAQSVEVNRGVLEGYTPPPMFDAPLTMPAPPPGTPDVMTPMPKKVIETIAPFENPPIPTKKPVRTYIAKNQPNGAVAAPVEPVAVEKIVTSKLQELEVETPDVRDVLASIAPDVELPPEREEPKKPEKRRVLAEPLPSAPNIISFQFMPNETELNGRLSPELLEKILAKTKGKPGTRIELHGFAASGGESRESEERRISLARALDMRSLLTENRIPSTIIDIKPLGRHTEVTPIDRVDIVFTN